MNYLFDKSTYNGDGSATIPTTLVERWLRQAHAPYADLSEPEKESDRREVRKILPYIEAFASAVGLD